MKRIDLKRMMDEIENPNREELKKDINNIMNIADDFVLIFIHGEGGGALAGISKNNREKMAMACMHFLKALATEAIKDGS